MERHLERFQKHGNRTGTTTIANIFKKPTVRRQSSEPIETNVNLPLSEAAFTLSGNCLGKVRSRDASPETAWLCRPYCAIRQLAARSQPCLQFSKNPLHNRLCQG